MIDYAEFEADDGLTYTGHLFNSVSSVTTAAGETFTGGGMPTPSTARMEPAMR